MTPLSIAVFARAPEPGLAKTRLIPRLGADGAARLQAVLTERALTRACGVPGAEVTLWVAGDIDSAFCADCGRRFSIGIRQQTGADLGARMQGAALASKAGGRDLIIIGTDCPAQTSADLLEAHALLEQSDVVLQPAFDGGYVLIGLRPSIHSYDPIFGDIEWGTEKVLSATRMRLRTAKLSFCELRPLPDLDRSEDLDHALAEGWIHDEEFR
ncbi:MAG: TIGR04282 family arsenosugar biosynthesis glycosyltransferase [Burkholderiaceae bacterium]